MNKNELIVAGVLFYAGFVNGQCLTCQIGRKEWFASLKRLIRGLKDLGLDPQAVEAACKVAISKRDPLGGQRFMLRRSECIPASEFIEGAALLLPPI